MPVLVPIFREDHITGLLDWASQIAAAEEHSIHVFWCPEGHTGEDVFKEVDANYDALPETLWPQLEHFSSRFSELETKVSVLKSSDRYHAILKQIKTLSGDLLLLGNQFSPKGEKAPESAILAKSLYQHASCDVVLFRITGKEVGHCSNILIPVSGGMNSRRALRMADRLSTLNEGSMTPFFVQPIGDDVAEEVGQRILKKSLIRARVKELERLNIQPKVTVRNSVIKAIRQEVSETSYDLVLIGGANTGTLRQKLFGTIPDSMLHGDTATTIAVIRRALPFTDRIKQQMGKLLSLSIPQLTRDDRIRVFEELQTKSKWSFDFMALIIASTAIASLGLIQNSPAVIIGAMLVAPLMTPLLGSGLALVQGNAPMMRDCAKAIILGFFCALGIGALMGWIASPFTDLTPEMLSRGGPSLLDMGVGFLSGIAASYCLSRPGLSSALAGVAIAAALVPPIATAGMSLSLGAPDNAMGAAILFGTNVVAIILGAAINFFLAGIRGKKNEGKSFWSRWIFAVLVFSLAALCVPLGSVIAAKIVETQQSSHRRALRPVINQQLDLLIPGALTTQEPTTRRKEGKATMILHIASPEVPNQETVDQLRHVIEQQMNTSITLDLRTQLSRRSESP